jgi:uncharacterized protein YndB with AHSA1/START domain
MKRTMIVFSMLGAFIVLILIYGYSLPVEHQISLSKHFDKTPDELWRVLIDYRKYAEWRENVYEVLEQESSGYDAWKEVDAEGHSIKYQITTHSPGTKLVVETTSAEESYSGSWAFDLIPDDNGTTLKITETGRIYNLFFRVIAHFNAGYSSDIETWMRSLENKFAVDKKLMQPVVLPVTMAEPVTAPAAPETKTPQAAAKPSEKKTGK